MLRSNPKPRSQGHSFAAWHHFRMFAGAVAIALACIAGASSAQAAACSDPLSAIAALPGSVSATLDFNSLRRFYGGSGGVCVWSAADAATFIKALTAVGEQGLDPRDFHLAELKGSDAIRDARARDLLLTDAALRYARDMRNGRLELESIESDIDFPRPVTDPVAGLRDAFATHSLAAWLASLPPSQPEYARLVVAYARYADMAAKGGWAMLDAPAKAVKSGEASPLVPTLRRRLAAEGDLDAADASATGSRLDGALVAALKRFQDRHGLSADGVVGRKTLEALNVAAADRAAQIAVNLERWRMLSGAISPTRVEVNAAAATAKLIVGGAPVLEMRAVVGKKKTPTPILRSVISSIVVNPPWVVPSSIMRKEILPALTREPDYLEKNDMYWRDNQIVQAPGERNSLGRIKFELSSSFDVYLHDTPARRLFARDDRARSHGCVRLEKPLALAEHLLGNDTGWPRERIEGMIADGKTQRIPLTDEVPIVIVYWTSFVDQDGTVEFRDDIYGRDEKLLDALRQHRFAQSGEPAAAAKSCGA